MHAPLRPAFRIEWRPLATLDDIADDWRALGVRALEPNVFYDPAFMLAAAPVFGQDAGAMLVWSTAGRLMGLFPARMGGRAGLRPAMTGWTHPYAPLGTPLVDREEAAAVIAAWLDHLAQGVGAPALLLIPLLPEAGPLAAALNAVLARSGRRSATLGRHQRALLSPGADRQGYVDRAVPARKRKELRRQRRRLEDVAPVTVTTATGASEVAVALQDFLLLEASGWKGMAGTAAVSDPAVRRFVETAVVALAAEGRARVDRLFLNGRAIAATVVLQSGDTAWCWKIAYSEGVAHCSPGVQLMLDLTQSLLGDETIARVDSCATADHPMIDHIWRERLALSDRLIALRPSAVPFALVCRIEMLRRRAIDAARAVRNRIRGF
jgi:CelD/BcsL family acetyltransferase involved in cellulose biosynthesis